MYLDFFQLKREPFHVTPDPAFFCFSPSHGEALAALIYGVAQRKGFIVVTGEVGVGKTTILRAFLERIDQTQTKVVYLLNANVALDDILKTLLRAFDAQAEAESTFQRVNQLNVILIEHYRQARNLVLIIDEAQNMPAETLEGLRVLSNLETATDKLLQIVFCGQPEFDEKLASPDLRQLKQRIAVRATVKPLTHAQGRDYIQHRLAMAGAPESTIFTNGAIQQILQVAQGVPRLINILCDNALVTAFGYQERQVTGRVTKEIIADSKASVYPRYLRWRLPAVGVAVAATGAGLFLSGVVRLDLMPDAEPRPSKPLQLTSIPESAQALTPVTPAPVPDTATGPTPATPEREDKQMRESETLPKPAATPETPSAGDPATTATESIAAKVSEEAPVERIVKPGDRLLDLVEDVYGVRDERLVKLVKQRNSQIKNPNIIRIGDRLIFPPAGGQDSAR